MMLWHVNGKKGDNYKMARKGAMVKKGMMVKKGGK